MSADFSAKPIDLAAEADFALGNLSVRPSLREVRHDSTSETLEPRVMQVLVALARRPGQVVSRDHLVTLCWEGRAVGEDAIQRAIAKVRKLGDATGAFSIDTVPRVGYRLRSGVAPRTKPAVTATPPEPILAVLPFDNLSDDREMQFFSDGVSEEILQTLTRTQGMKTIGRASSFQFRGTDKTIRKVAAELGATHVLDGSVRRAGERIRVSAQLIDATTQTTAWAEQYDHELSDILRLQTDVATSVTKALHANLVHTPEPTLIDPIAFELCARARSLAYKFLSDDDIVASVSLLEQAVERAPHYAEAWGLLAGNRSLLIPRTHDEPSSLMRQAALTAANTALALDSATPSALRALAFLVPGFSGYQERLNLSERGVRLAPNDPLMQSLQAAALSTVGRYKASLPFSNAAANLEPLSPGLACLHALALLTTGSKDEGMDLLDRTCTKFPNQFGPWFFRAWAVWVRDQPKMEDNPFFSDDPLRLGLPAADVAALRGLHAVTYLPQDQREAAIRRLVGPEMPMLWLGVVKAASWIGCIDAAFDALFSAFENGRPIAAYSSGNLGLPRSLQSSVLFLHDARALYCDPRFARVCAHLNLVDYWMTSGLWPDCADEVPYDFRAKCEKAARELR